MATRIVCLFTCFILVNALPAPSLIKDNIAEETNVAKSLYAVVEPDSDYEDTDSVVKDPTWIPKWDEENSESDYSSYEYESDSYEDRSTVSYEENYSYESVVSDESSSKEKKDVNIDTDLVHVGEEGSGEPTEESLQENKESNDILKQNNEETESAKLIKKYESRKKRFVIMYKRSTDESQLSVIGKDDLTQSKGGSNDKSIPYVENNNDDHTRGDENAKDQTTQNSADEETISSTEANNDAPTESIDTAEEDSTQSDETSDNDAKTEDSSSDENENTDTSSNDKSLGSDDDSLSSKDEETPERFYLVKYLVFINNFGISCNDIVDKLTGEVVYQDCPFQRSVSPADYTVVRILPVAGPVGF